ncbi:MAG: hypothetical protein LC795_15570 [Acidobacteria bacterium]|nr:hypothetical protein [Acidobacteriota bacterium]MCA1620694.1 hypothetical protein [Acidobacteriota bacterium]
MLRILSLFKFLTPGDALKDTALAAYGYWPALVMHMETGLLLGLLNLLVVVIFRVVELRHRMKIERLRALKKPDEADKKAEG